MARSSQRPSATGPDRAAPGHSPAAGTQEVLRRLELNVNRRLDGILHGEYRGLVPGHGSEMCIRDSFSARWADTSTVRSISTLGVPNAAVTRPKSELRWASSTK